MSSAQTLERVAVIGAGPAGLALADLLRERVRHARVVIFEAGRPHTSRICPVDMGRSCGGCGGTCNVISGFGGCLHYGDSVKISRFPAGRRLAELFGEKHSLLEDAAIDFFGLKSADFAVNDCALWGDHEVRQYSVAEIPESRLKDILARRARLVADFAEIRLRSPVTGIQRRGEKFLVKSRRYGDSIEEIFDAVVLCTGRAGIRMRGQSLFPEAAIASSGIPSLGIRIELPRERLVPFYSIHKDFKVSSRRSDGHAKFKTFCFSSHASSGGRIKFCYYHNQFSRPAIFLDGHTSYEKIEDVGNLAVLCQLAGSDYRPRWVEEVFVRRYQESLGGFPCWQPLAPLLGHRQIGEARPRNAKIIQGSLSELLGDRLLGDLVSFFESLARVACEKLNMKLSDYLQGGVVMAPAVEFLWDTAALKPSCESSVKNFYLAGDCAGWAQGVLQSTMMGIAAGEDLAAGLLNRSKVRLEYSGRPILPSASFVSAVEDGYFES